MFQLQQTRLYLQSILRGDYRLLSRALLLFFLGIFLGFSKASAAEQVRCESLLLDSSAHSAFESETKIQVGSARGLFGEEVLRITLKLRGLWAVFNGEVDNPGDLTWAFEHVPSSLKKLFSVKAFDQNHAELIQATSSEKISIVEIPSARETNRASTALEKYMRVVDSKIALFKFYSADGVISSIEYIKNLALLKLPMASMGSIFEHDFNYHFLSALVTPAYVTTAIQHRAQLLSRYIDFMQSKDPAFAEKIASEAASGFDTTVGNFFMNVMVLKNEAPHAELMQVISEQLRSTFFDQFTPSGFLDALIRSAKPNSKNISAYLEFRKSLSPQDTQIDLPKDFYTNPESLCDESLKWLKKLNTAAQQFLRQQGIP
jgi:hypothetical protein